jgi:AcrR family transcriptional regulator
MQAGTRGGEIDGGERLDAARNRRRLLETALDIVSERGADALTLDDLARRAGVGKGTIFRRFGSRSGLMQALLDHAQRDFQHSYMSGPAPLGPGAPPLERIHAFGGARIRGLEITGELRRAASVDEFTHYRHPTRRLELAHLTMLLSAPISWSPSWTPDCCCICTGQRGCRWSASLRAGRAWWPR